MISNSTIQTTSAANIETKALRAALDWVGKATDGRRSEPWVYKYVLMHNDGGWLTFAATSDKCWAETSIETDNLEAWTIALPIKALKEMLVGVKDKTIGLINKGSQYSPYLLILAGGEEKRIDGKSMEDFPTNPTDKASNKYITHIDCASWHAVAVAAARDDTRSVLEGVLLDGENMVAADGFRLAVAPGPVIDGLRAIIPITIRKLLPTTGTAGLYLNPEHTYATLELDGRRRITVPLIQGNYPNYPQLIPAIWNAQVTIGRQALLDACNRLAPLVKNGSGIVWLMYDGGSLIVHVQPEEGDVIEERLAATRNGPEGFQIAFNIRYLQELLPTLTTPDVVIEIIRSSAPAVFVGAASGPKWIVMPMFVKW